MPLCLSLNNLALTVITSLWWYQQSAKVAIMFPSAWEQIIILCALTGFTSFVHNSGLVFPSTNCQLPYKSVPTWIERETIKGKMKTRLAKLTKAQVITFSQEMLFLYPNSLLKVMHVAFDGIWLGSVWRTFCMLESLYWCYCWWMSTASWYRQWQAIIKSNKHLKTQLSYAINLHSVYISWMQPPIQTVCLK